MSGPLVSIIAPVYKVEALLPRCLDSVRAQTFEDFELILIDDGSPDGSGAICDRYAAQDARFVVIHQRNSGVGTARNAGLAKAHGALVSYIDTDDFLNPGYLEHLVAAQRLHGADMAVARFHRLSDADAARDFVSPARGDQFVERPDFPRALTELCEDTRIYTLWAKVYARELLDGLRYDPAAVIGGDTVLMGEILARARSIQLTDAADYYYCERSSGTITSQVNPDLYRAYLSVHERFCASLAGAGYVTDELTAVLNRRLSRYATRAIHSIRRGPWPFAEQCLYVAQVLEQDALLNAVRIENESNPQHEYQLILSKDSAALLRFYARRDHKNQLARRFPGAFSVLSGVKHMLKGGGRG